VIRLGDMVTRAARRSGERPALTSGSTVLTWRAVETRIWRAARGLAALGIAPGDRVAFLGHNSHRYFECYYAPARIGAITVPINSRLAPAELAQVLADCTPVALIADDAHWQAAVQMQRDLGVAHLIHADDGPAPEGAPSYDAMAQGAGEDDGAGLPSPGRSSDDVAMIFYTGGTTGQPKGVMLTHANLFANTMAAAQLYGFRPYDTQMLSGPMFHLGSGSRVFSAPLLSHHTVITPRFEPLAAMQTIARHRIECIQLVPTMLAMMMEHPEFGRYDLGSLRLISYGASVMPQSLMQRVMTALPGVTFCQGYGMTECAPLVTILTPDQHYPGSPTLNSIGVPPHHVDLRIVDAADRDVPPGVTGEIITRGPQVMKGYWNQPELTAHALRGGWYHTGDAAWMGEDGVVRLAGRTVEMIVTGGENVYPVETENALSLHPAVAEVAVIGLPDPHWGARVHAVVRLKPGQQACAQVLRDHCRPMIAGYKLPRSFSFRTDPLPQTNVAKIDKARLRRECLAQTATEIAET